MGSNKSSHSTSDHPHSTMCTTNTTTHHPHNATAASFSSRRTHQQTKASPEHVYTVPLPGHDSDTPEPPKLYSNLNLSEIVKEPPEVPKMHSSRYYQKDASVSLSISQVQNQEENNRLNKSKADKSVMLNQTCHEIDVTHYEAPEDAVQQLQMSIMVDPHDPFDDAQIARFLANLERPVDNFPNYHEVPGEMPSIEANRALSLGKCFIKILYTRKYSLGKFSLFSLTSKIVKIPCKLKFNLHTILINFR
jgi:hypothetical protein